MASSHGQKTGRDMMMMEWQMYEVHFRHNFVQYHPWGNMPDTKDSPRRTWQVLQLCHATHNEQAREIDRGDGLYRFKPHPKCGKWGDKSYYYTKKWAQTPDMDTPSYQAIPQGEEVFPDCYSWWGLAVDPSDAPPLENPPRCLPPYLKTPPESVYGGNAFQSSFSNLLQCYATSRDCTVQDVYLRMGGTLRYKREIGYVVIICTSDDLGELKTYKSITDAPPRVFDPNDLVNEKGKIQDVACVPCFTTQYMNTFSSHEALNFAFYFPSPATEFRCHNIKRHQIKHNGNDGLCINRVTKDGELRCPDYTDIASDNKESIEMASFFGQELLKTGREIGTTLHGEEQKYEVYFPHGYVQYHPWGEMPFTDTELLLPVSKLCHATHSKEARQIRCGDGYHFIPHKRAGRSHTEDYVTSEISRPYRSYHCTLKHGQTPDETTQCYRLIPESEQVLPGYFSWWGLAMNRKSPPNLSGITAPKGNLPGYLKNPPQSFYGKYAFVSSFQNLLESYRTSRQCQTVYLRMGGTLRYKCEIGYVVVVCTSYDYDALFNYEPLTHDNTILDTTHLANEDGKIINKDVTPYFTTQYIDASSSYETLNFALYFQDKGDLKCCANFLEEVEVNHEGPCLHKQCIRYFYDRDSGRFKYYEKCPDKVTQEDLDRHWKTTSIAEN